METEKRERRRQRGLGSTYLPKYRDRKTGEVRECKFFWIQYQKNGRPIRENTHSDKITVAREILKKRLGQIENGSWAPPKTHKILVSELIDSVLRDYRNRNFAKRAKLTEQRWQKHLQPVFGEMRACDVTTDTLAAYIEARKSEGAENGTINRETAILRHAFRDGAKAKPPKVRELPIFSDLEENPARTGFVNDAQYKTLCANCGEHCLRTMLALAYSFGFRKGELLNLRVRQVDLLHRTVTLNAADTKNGKPRNVSLTNESYTLLCQSIVGKRAEDFVFTWKDGRPVKDFRVSWEKLTKASGVPELLFHDLRRSAVRNMIRRGVPQVTAQRISGHKTRDVFDRYNIGDDRDLVDAAARIEAGEESASFALTLPNANQNQQRRAN